MFGFDAEQLDFDLTLELYRQNRKIRAKRRSKLAGMLAEIEEYRMSAIDRIKAKALEARGVATNAIRAFEADLDGLIAEKSTLDHKRAEAVAPHKEVISGIYSEIDGLKAAMDLLSNGGPPLEPSAPIDHASTGLTPPPIDLATRRDRP